MAPIRYVSPCRLSGSATITTTVYAWRSRPFDTPGTGELRHPVWGSIKKAQLVSYDITHTTDPDFCTVDLQFVESADEILFFSLKSADQVQETVGAPGDQAVDESVNAVEDVVDATRDANPLAALDDLRKSMLGPVLALTAQVRGVISSGLDVMNYPRAWARDIASLSNGLLSIANFPNRLMSEWRAIANVFKAIRLQWGGNTSSSGYSPWQRGTAPSEAQATAVVQSYMAVSMATAQADAAAIVLAFRSRDANVVAGQKLRTVADSTRDEIEAAILAVRAALPIERSRLITEPLKSQALAIQQAALAIIEARPPMVRRTLNAPGNLRLVAHRLYGDHTRAIELLRLNNLRNPNALQTGDTLNAYAR